MTEKLYNLEITEKQLQVNYCLMFDTPMNYGVEKLAKIERIH